MEERLKNHIIKTYNPIAIVLSGSRVSGNFSKNSDWDFYIFLEKMPNEVIWEYKNETLDINPIEFPFEKSFILDTKYHPEQHLKIIYDKSDGQIEDLIKRTNEKYNNGPEEINDREYQRLQKIMKRYIKKSDDRLEIKGLSFYYLGIFYEIALRLWFQTRKEWPLPPYEAIPHIQEKDPEFYNLLYTISESRDIEKQISAAKEIYKKLFNEVVT